MTNEPAVVSTTACLFAISATVRGVVNGAAGVTGRRCACADGRPVSADSSRAAKYTRSIIGRLRDLPPEGGDYRSPLKPVVSAFRRNLSLVMEGFYRIEARGPNSRI